MLQAMDDATERQQIKFSVGTLVYAIDDMLKMGGTHVFYSNIVQGDRLYGPGVLAKHVLDVVVALQRKYAGIVVVSRTPGGIVADRV